MRSKQAAQCRGKNTAATGEPLERRTLLSATPVTLATVAGAAPQVAVDAAGDVFGTTAASGTSGGTVFEIPVGSHAVRTLATFPAGAVTGSNPKDILVDAAGNLFGDSSGAPDGDVLWELPAGGSAVRALDTFAYNTIGTSAAISLSIDAFDDLFVSYHSIDYSLYSNLYTSFDEYVAAQAGFGSIAFGEAAGHSGPYLPHMPEPSDQLLDPVAADPAGNAYFVLVDPTAGTHLYRTAAGAAAYEAAGTVEPANSQVDLGTIGTPVGMTTDAAGDLFITETGGAVQEVRAGTSAVITLPHFNGTFAGTPAADAAGDLFSATLAGTLVELPADGTAFTVVDANTNGIIAGLIATADGNLYGTGTSGTAPTVLEFPGVGTAATVAPPAPPVLHFPTYTITGTVFNDANGNGARDKGEAGVAGQTVYVDVNGDGKPDDGEPSVTTNSAGTYTVEAVRQGTYALRDVVPSGSTQTSPTAGSYAVTVVANGSIADQNFGEVATAVVLPRPAGLKPLGSMKTATTDAGVDAAGDVFAVAGSGTDGVSGAGAVFEVPAGTTTAAQVASLGPAAYVDDPAGRGPYGHIVVDGAGDVFGLTEGGNIPGNLWERFAGSSTVVNLDGFTGVASQPDNLTVDAAGDLFGTAIVTHGNPFSSAAEHGEETVLFEYPADGSGERLLTLPGVAVGPIVADAAGNLFGLNATGGDPTTGTAATGYDVYEVKAAAIAAANRADPATVTQLASFTVAAQGAPAGLATDAADDLFLTTATAILEIPHGTATVHRLATATGDLTLRGDPLIDAAGDVFAVGTASVDGSGAVLELAAGSPAIVELAALPQAPTDLAHDAAGNLYDVTFNFDGSEIYELTGKPFVVAKSVTPTPSPTATAINLTLLGTAVGEADSGIAIDGSGNIFGTTVTNRGATSGQVFEIASGKTAASTVATFDAGIFADNPAPDGQGPFGRVVVDKGGDVFGLTAGPIDNGTLWERKAGSSAVVTLATLDNGVLDPSSLTADAAGDLFGTYVDTTYDPYQSYAATGYDTVVFEYPADGSGLRVVTAPGNAQGPIVSDAAGDLFGLDAIVQSPSNVPPTAYELYEISAAAIAAATADAPAGATGLGSFDVADYADVGGGSGGPAGGVPVGLTVDAAGDLFVATNEDPYDGGTPVAGAILELPAGARTVRRLASLPGGLTLTSAPAVDGAGDVFAVGTLAGRAVVVELPAGSTKIAEAAALPGNAVPYNVGPDLALGAAGQVDVLATLAGSAQGRTTQIFAVTGKPFAIVATQTPTPTPTPTPSPTPTPTPTGTAGLAPAPLTSTVPTTAVANTGVRGTVRVTLTNTTGAAMTSRKASVIRVYATTTGAIDASSTLVGTVRRAFRLAAGATASLALPVRTGRLAAGDYKLLVQATDSAGDVVTTTGPALAVSPPTVALSAVVGAMTPTALVAGRRATLTLTLANGGNVVTRGKLTFTVELTTDGATSAGTLATLSQRAPVRPGRSATVHLRFKVPAGLTAGSYRIMLGVAGDGSTASAVGSQAVIVATG